MKQTNQTSDIDFVIAWVDGSDKAWLNEKSKYQADAMHEDDSNARYRDWDNLKYWFRSVEQYAPWVRMIHFVTWGHVPAWLDVDNPRIHIVRHEDYIPHEYLPTFNSHTIELNLHRISGLAERFVYFNDDMFLNRPVLPEDFFGDGLPCDIMGLDCIAFGKNSAGCFNANDVGLINDHFDVSTCFRQHKSKWLNIRYGMKVPVRTLFLLKKGYFTGFYYQHTTSGFLKQTFTEVWEKEREVLDDTCSCRFRNQTNVNQWLMKYWQLAKGNFCPRKKKFGMYFQIKDDTSGITEAIKTEKYEVICLNDTGTVKDFDKVRDEICMAFEERFPQRSGFEI